MLERVLRAREARATMIAERIVDIYRRDRQGHIPALQAQPSFAGDEHWKDLLLFYEYFHADTGLGSGASDRMDRTDRPTW